MNVAFFADQERKMDKTEKLIDWREDERKDANRDGIDDRIEPPIPDIAAGSAKLQRELQNPGADPAVTGGDPDVRWESAQFAGDESPVSSTPTPDQNDVDQLGRAMGVTYADDEELKVGEKEESRDEHRWELDPASADDYNDRVRDEEDNG
jgi:hypothetical protein